MNNYISIKEFATQAKVSPQAIYQRIEKDLKPYLKVIEGKKSLNIKALELFNFNLKDALIEQNKILQDTLKVLTNQLEVKDIQISELNMRLKEAQELNNQILLKGEQNLTNLDFSEDNFLIENNKDKNLDSLPDKKGFRNFFKK